MTDWFKHIKHRKPTLPSPKWGSSLSYISLYFVTPLFLFWSVLFFLILLHNDFVLKSLSWRISSMLEKWIRAKRDWLWWGRQGEKFMERNMENTDEFKSQRLMDGNEAVLWQDEEMMELLPRDDERIRAVIFPDAIKAIIASSRHGRWLVKCSLWSHKHSSKIL